MKTNFIFGSAVFLMFLASCWGACPNCPGWEATPKAGFERMAAARHEMCVQNNPCYFVSQCHRDSEAFCLDAGYPKTCGNAEVEGSCGINVK